MNEHATPSGPDHLFTLIGAAHGLEARLEDGLSEVGLSLAKQGVLGTLAAAGAPIPLGELAKRQSCARSNITQLVDRLEADGLVRRTPDPDDRRGIRAELTVAGAAREREGRHVVDAARESFRASLPEDDLAALARVLSTLQ